MSCDPVENFFIDNNIDYVVISDEIFLILNLKNFNKDVTNDIENFLDKKFLGILEKTFSKKIVLYYAEAISEEVLLLFHNYFRNKCCNIGNIVLLVSSSGVLNYYKNYCNLNRSLGMNVVEIPMVDLLKYFENLKIKKFNKNINRFFSFYGGTYETIDKTFLSLFMTNYKNFSSIEIMCKCSSLEKLESWLEKNTFFMNANFVEKYCNLHKTYINEDLNLCDDLKIKINDDAVYKKSIAAGKYQEAIDSQCLFTVIRETINFQPFAYISEKTFRCFYDHIIPIPIDGKEIIADLKRYGFWIDEDFFDYSYLQEDLFEKKILKLEKSIEKITQLSYTQLNDYYQANLDNFEHNQHLLLNWPRLVHQELEKNFLTV